MLAMATSQMNLRIPVEDHQFLKDFVAQYPEDNLNAMMSRWIRERIVELDTDPDVHTPQWDRQPSKDEPVLYPPK